MMTCGGIFVLAGRRGVPELLLLAMSLLSCLWAFFFGVSGFCFFGRVMAPYSWRG